MEKEMTKLRNSVMIIIMILFFLIASHLDFLTEVQKGNAVDCYGNKLTMQDATWFCDRF